MPELTTETPTTPTEGAPSSEAAATSLLTSAEPAATTPATAEATDKTVEADKLAEAAKVEGAPDKYKFTPPEGKTYDPAVIEPFAEAARAANLTQDVAASILDKMAPVLAERQAAQVKAVQDGWSKASKEDKEFGGEKFSESLATAKKAYDTYVTPEFKTLLETTGLGNHPEVIRFMLKVGQHMSEDRFVAGAGTPTGVRDLGKILYPNTPKKE